MKLKHLSKNQLKKMVKEAVSKHLSLSQYHLFFFGSRAKGDASLRSDIDIGIEGKQNIPAYIKIAIEEELERLPLLYKLDFVDFKRVSPGFKKEALKFIEKIN